MRSAFDILSLCLAALVPNLFYLALGLPLLRMLGAAVGGCERVAIAYLLGTGVASLGFLSLRAADVPIPMLALAAATGLAVAFNRVVPAPRASSASTSGAPPWIRALDAASLGVAALLFVSAVGPEVGWDALEYHLPIVQAWTEGPIRALPGVLDAEFRNGVDLLYLPALAAKQPDAAAGVAACFAATLAALVRAEASRRASAGAAAWAGLLVLLSPLCQRAAITADVDLAVGAYGFAALLFADRWNRGGDRSLLWLCVLTLAFVANAKLHAAILVPAVGLLLATGGRVPSLGTWTGASALLASLILPWFIKLGLTTGNPLFPLFGDLLGRGNTTAEHLAGRRSTLLQAFPVERNPMGLLRWLGFVSFGTEHSSAGSLGPLPLALAPFAIRKPSRSNAALVFVLLTLLLLQFAFMRPVRFGTPVWGFLAVASAVGGVRLARSGAAARAVVATGLLAVAALATTSFAGESARRVAAIRAPEPFRRAAWPDQFALAEMVAEGEPVVAISMGAALWMPKPVYNLHWERNGELFFLGTPPDQLLALLRERGVRSLVVAVTAPLPGNGRVGHPTVDAWLHSGRARLRLDVPPRVKRGNRVWVLVDLK